MGRIGDFVLTLSALRLLINAFGADGCVLVLPPSLATLAAAEFPGVDQITLPMEAASLVRGILPVWRHQRSHFARDDFQQLICLSHQRSLYYEVALSWISANHEVRLRPETYPTVPTNDLSTELLAHWRVAEIALGRKVSREEILPRFESIAPGHDGRLLVYPLSLDPSRSVPVSRMIEVLRHWRKRSPAPIVLGAGPADQIELERYANAARQAGITNVVIESPAGIDGLLAHLAQAGAIFAADSGAAHIAAALDKPLVLVMDTRLYGYANPWQRSARQRVFLNTTGLEEVAAALPAL
jgi:ADP-heptose:LPS heptosyltransferase